MLFDLKPAEIDEIYASEDSELQQLLYRANTSKYYSFEPLPDDPGDFQEQTAFLESKVGGSNELQFVIALGGTGSGKTEVAGQKTVRYILENRPPRLRTPFWIIGDTYDQVCDVCWNEKMSNMIPQECIYGIDWYRQKRNWPYAVFLKHPDNPENIGWVLEFKSYEQGLTGMKAKSIGGYWFNEEVPYAIVLEVQGRCRDYNSPGWADFTPIEVKSPEWPEKYEKPPPGWKFFHFNMEHNKYLAPGFAKWYLSQIPEDLRDTRRIGTFSTFLGQVFKEWRKSIHVIPPFKIPHDWRRVRGMDFGFNNPFACVWCARDFDGRWYIYREHEEAGRLNGYHAAIIEGEHWDYNSPHYGPTYSDHDAQQRAEFASLGIPCTPANKTNLNAGIAFLRSLMMVQGDGKPKFFVFDTCPNTIREISGYRFPEGTVTRNPNDAPIDKDNHLVDAARYACWTDHLMESRAGIPSPFAAEHRPNSRRHGITADLRKRSMFGGDGNGRNGNGRNGH